MKSNKERLPKRIAHLFEAKERRRRALARLPFEKKIEILVQLQRWASSIERLVHGVKREPWKI